MLAVMIAQMADIVAEPLRQYGDFSSEALVCLVHCLPLSHLLSNLLTFCEVFESRKVGAYWDNGHQYCEKDELEQHRSEPLALCPSSSISCFWLP